MGGPLRLAPDKAAQLQHGTDVRKDLKLLEVDEDVLRELQARGGFIKGGSTADEAVLCTETHTYALKHVQTTNTVLLMPPQQGTAAAPAGGPAHAAVIAVGGETDHHMEAVLCAPRLAALGSMLKLYDGEAEEAADMDGEPGGAHASDTTRDDAISCAAEGPFTFEELFDRLPASRAELQATLQQLGGFELDGRWRKLEADYLDTLLEVLLLSAMQHGWQLEALPEDQVAAAMHSDGFDSRVARHCVSLFCDAMDVSQETNPSDQRQWALNHRKVALHFARKLLRRRQQWERPEFMAAWQSALPEGVSCTEDMLQGEVLQEAGDTLCYFPASALPTQPAARFAVLFEQRPRWEAKDLQPYLEGIQAPGQSAEALLLRYARASQTAQGANIVYSAR